MRKRINLYIILLFLTPVTLFSQSIKISDYEREDNRDINFEIIGKMDNNVLVYKNIWSRHKINIFGPDMNTINTVKLDFLPKNTFNIDFVAYKDFFYMIYQYQKGSILHCMMVKMDASAKMMSEPVELDTTRIPVMSNNKIYTTIYSEDRQYITIFKIQTRFQKFSLATMLFDSQMKLVNRSRFVTDFNERKDNYDNFLLANDGNFMFTYARQTGNRDYSSSLFLVTKPALSETFSPLDIGLNEKYVDAIKLKIDSRNNRYILNSFYYKRSYGSIDGLFVYIWDKTNEKTYANQFIELSDSLRYEAKSGGMLRFALDNFFIRQVTVKGDGGYLLTAEDFSYDTRGINNFNRYDYLYSPWSVSPGYYYYNPYTGYYRPLSSYGNQTTRYYFNNIMILSISKTGQLEWDRVIHKSQFEDNDENFLSFSMMTSGNEIHFLYNTDRKYQIIADQGLTPDGNMKRYPTLKSEQRGYEFMPSLSKQVGARQIIIPCTYRNFICFAKVEF